MSQYHFRRMSAARADAGRATANPLSHNFTLAAQASG
jgi:hypothetical protein